jgi:hypothetical protein
MKPWAGDLFDTVCGKAATGCRPYIQLDKMTKKINLLASALQLYAEPIVSQTGGSAVDR